MENKSEVIEQFANGLVEVLNDRQTRANQYVVAYKRKSDDEVIGYHADTFCTLKDDILEGKRYAGEDPTKQLQIIWDNFKTTMSTTDEEPGFLGVPNVVRKRYYQDVNIDDIYIDAVYLANGVPPKEFHATIINPDNNGTENNEGEGA